MNILITRPIEQSITFINKLSKNGFSPFLLPLIEITPLEFSLNNYNFDYIIFTSQNSCKFFINYLKNFDLEKTNIVAIGTKTSYYLKNKGIKVDLIPNEYSSDGLKELFARRNINNKKILIPGSSIRDRNFEDFCKKNNNSVTAIDIYTTNPIIYQHNYIDNFINEYAIEVITLFSPSAAQALLDQFDYLSASSITYICIGNKTSKYLKEKGLNSLYPDEFTEDGILDILIRLQRRENEISRN
jgi:uroporphyrinogen-III synthase